MSAFFVSTHIYIYISTKICIRKCVYVLHMQIKKHKARANTYGAAPLHAFETHFPLSQESLCVFQRQEAEGFQAGSRFAGTKSHVPKSTTSIISATSKWKKEHVVGNGLCPAWLSTKTSGNSVHGTLLWGTPAGHSCGKILTHSCKTLLWNTPAGHSCKELLWACRF